MKPHFPLLFTLSCLLGTALIGQAASPRVSFQPKDQAVTLYQQAAFGVIASGTLPLSYQWHKDGVPIAGATNDQIVLAHAQFADAGPYSVVVSNTESSVTSAEAVLTVNPPKYGDIDFQFGLVSPINRVNTLAIQADGKVVIAGTITGIIRLNIDGTTDFTFMNGLSGTDSPINSVAVQSDGKVLIGGFFSSVNGVPAPYIARLWGTEFPPQIKSINRGGADVNLSWHAISNRTYRVQYGGSLSATNWTDLAGDISATGATASKSDTTPADASQRFYRVVLLP